MSDILGSFWQSVVMEARKKNEDEDPTDYTEDEPDIEDTDVDAGNEPETEDEGSTDYTVEDDEIGDDDGGEDSTDYTTDNPDTDGDTGDDTTTTINAGEPDEPADEGDNDSTDYSAGADDGLSLDDDGGDADNAGDDGNGDGDEPTLDTGEGDSTDYTAGTDDTGKDSGEDDSGGGADSSDDSSSDDSSGGDDDSPKNDKLRKYYLLKDFGNLQTFIQDGIDKLTEKKRESFLDKQVDMQCVSNFNRLLNAISDYMIFKFDEDDYVTALYNYKRFMVLVNMNIALLEKRKENAERIFKGAKKTPETK